jgi:hypothetical protein
MAAAAGRRVLQGDARHKTFKTPIEWQCQTGKITCRIKVT